MEETKRPNVRDLAGSAVDLNGYAVLFKAWARQANQDGYIQVPAAKLVTASDFFSRLVDELLELIPPNPVEDVK